MFYSVTAYAKLVIYSYFKFLLVYFVQKKKPHKISLCFVYCCLSFSTFSFGHCVVCSSSIYGFWLPLWYLQALLIITLSCILRSRKYHIISFITSLCYAPRPSPEYLCGKRNTLYPIRANSFVSIVLHLIHKILYIQNVYVKYVCVVVHLEN